MTTATADAEALRAAEIAANPDDLPTDVADNPSPSSPGASGAPAASAGAPGQDEDPDRVLTAAEKRQAVVDHVKAQRRAADGEPTSVVVTTQMGEFIPPFIVKAQAAQQTAADAAAEEEAARAAAAEPSEPAKSYTLKVRGNDVPVASRDELLQLAEVEPDEADLYTDAALIRLAQKQMASSAILEDAKATAKTARQTARASDSTPSDPAVTNEPDVDPPEPDRQHPADPLKKAWEAIQFGEEKEGVEALRSVVTDAVAEDRIVREGKAISARIKTSADTFAAANPDIANDADLAPLFIERYVRPVIEKALVATGRVSPERAAEACATYDQAIQSYTLAAASGLVAVDTPDQLLGQAVDAFRVKFPKRAEPTPTPSPTPTHDRAQAKRSLPPQPSRGSSIQAPVQAEPANKAVAAINRMRAARGQSVHG